MYLECQHTYLYSKTKMCLIGALLYELLIKQRKDNQMGLYSNFTKFGHLYWLSAQLFSENFSDSDSARKIPLESLGFRCLSSILEKNHKNGTWSRAYTFSHFIMILSSFPLFQRSIFGQMYQICIYSCSARQDHSESIFWFWIDVTSCFNGF